MKHIPLLFTLSLFISTFLSQAQDSTVKSPVYKTKHIGFGGVYSFHQDTRYSNVQYKGGGFGYNIGGSRETSKRISSTQFLLQTSSERPSTFKEPSILSANYRFSLFYRYLYKINNTYSLGGRMELLNGYFRITEGLFNNSFNYLVGNSWYISGHFRKKINTRWVFNGFIDFSLFSIQKGSTGFGFSTPHRILEKGKFNYQDSFEQPTSLQGYGIDPFWKSIIIKTSLRVSYKERVSMGYNWNFNRFIATRKYPIYSGFHSIMVYYNIFKKEKNR